VIARIGSCSGSKRGSEESPPGTGGRSKEGTAKMLRITVVENALEDRWTLQGTLTKSSVVELLSNWRASTCSLGRRRIVNLDKVTSIDKSGEEAICLIMRDGATVVASGVYTKHLLDELKAREGTPEKTES
jgi:ABC-type transporter Mla MlaB component